MTLNNFYIIFAQTMIVVARLDNSHTPIATLP